MSSSDRELERQLMEAGKRLTDPSPSVEELLPLLDQVENCLSKAEQSPSQSMQNALSPSLKALVTEQIFRHPDADVKVAVASCISEITRITAPDAPYDDDQMKEVFQLIVSSFENLFDKSSRSYAKRTSILETVAKVRSCVVMLDLECDALIIEMFQHFFKTIRDYHPEDVFSSMETIMTLVLEESEDISMELLSPLLACVKRDNEEVMPIARKLAESVLQTCNDKLKPCLTEAVKTLGISLNDYSEVIASICQDTSNQISQDGGAISNQVVQENKPARASLDGAIQDDQINSPGEVDPAEEVVLPNDKSAKSVASNGVVREDDSLQDSSLLKKQEHAADVSNAAAGDNLKKPNEKKEARMEGEASDDGAPKTRLGRRSESKARSSRMRKKKAAAGVSTKDKIPSETKRESSVVSDLEAKAELIKIQNEGTKDSEMKSVKHSGEKAARVVSDEDKIQCAEDEMKEESEGASDMEVKETKQTIMIQKKGTNDPQVQVSRRTGKKAASGVSSEDKISSLADETKEEDRSGVSDSEAEPLKLSIKKVNSRKENGKKSMPKHLADKKKSGGKDGLAKVEQKSSQKTDVEEVDLSPKSLNHKNDGPHPADKKKRSRGKVVLEKAEQKSSEKTDVEVMDLSPKSLNQNNDKHHLEETPKAISKRMTSASKEKASGSVEYDETLIGLNVKVWWPQDKMFYKGVIDGFDPLKKRHKVVYNDGEVEVLNMRKQKWEVIADENGSSEDEGTDHANPDALPEMLPKKKMKIAQRSIEKSNVDAWPRKARVATDSKSKGAATKSGQKSSNTANSEGKPKGGSKSVSKPETDVVTRTKDHTPNTSSSKTADSSLKAIGKSRNDVTPKTSKSKEDGTGLLKSAKSKEDASKSLKSKQETPKISAQSGAKLTGSASNKQKSGLPETPVSKPKSSKKRRR